MQGTGSLVEDFYRWQEREYANLAAQDAALADIRWLWYGIIAAAKKGEGRMKAREVSLPNGEVMLMAPQPGIWAFGRGSIPHRLLVDPELMPMREPDEMPAEAQRAAGIKPKLRSVPGAPVGLEVERS